MSVYPAGIDSWANPTTTTEQDDPGFSHSALHARVQDAVEVIEAKLGTGSGTPTLGNVLRGTAPGASGWGQIGSEQIAPASILTANLALNAATRLSATTLPGESTASTAQVGMTGSNLSVQASGAPLLVGFTLIGCSVSPSPALIQIQLWEGGGNVLTLHYGGPQSAGIGGSNLVGVQRFVPAAGPHSYFLTWSTSSGTAGHFGGSLYVVDLFR